MISRCLCGLLCWICLVAAAPHAQHLPVARVSALENGQLLLNGKPANVAAIETEFRRLKRIQGAVLYHRENAHAEPPAHAMAVVKLIIKHQLPVSMSSKADFSDYVDAHGRSRPRTP